MRLLSTIKSKLTAIIAIVLALCFGFAALGCNKSESDYEYALRIAKEEFECKKILWVKNTTYRNSLTQLYLYYGNNGYYRWDDCVYTMEGGYYVLGVDKYGCEKFIVVPHKQYAERSLENSPRLIQWPFAYSFTEIANFAAEYGYEYADGIDGKDSDECWLKVFRPIDREVNVKETVEFIGKFTNDDAIYDRLDAKFILYFRHIVNDNQHNDYFIMQESGKLMLYEDICTYGDGEDLKESVNVIEYKRDKQDAQTQTV